MYVWLMYVIVNMADYQSIPYVNVWQFRLSVTVIFQTVVTAVCLIDYTRQICPWSVNNLVKLMLAHVFHISNIISLIVFSVAAFNLKFTHALTVD